MPNKRRKITDEKMHKQKLMQNTIENLTWDSLLKKHGSAS